MPDVGIMGREEMTQATQRITSVCDISVFVDADTGYGNALNVYHAVQGYFRAGAAGLHIEDQESPKRSGTGAGRKCVSQQEAVGKFKAAMAAKQELDPEFVICARCDLIGAEGGSFEADAAGTVRSSQTGTGQRPALPALARRFIYPWCRPAP